jgi:PAS domain-containing protein
MKEMFAHEADELAERSIGEFCATLKLGGVGVARVKATQWLTWTGRWDGGPGWDIDSLDALHRARIGFESEGIAFRPWGCPMGLDSNGHTAYNDATVRAEVMRFAEIANECGYIDLDVEPYAEFWPALAVDDYRAVEPFFRLLREEAPDARIVIDVPYRNSTWEGDRISKVLEIVDPYVDEVWFQSYFGVAQMLDAEARARRKTDRPLKHIVSCTNDNPGFAAQVRYLSERGDDDVAIWIAQAMDGAKYATLAQYAFDSPPPEGDIRWQSPENDPTGGFQAFYLAHPDDVGTPTTLPYADSLGNVWQESASGTMIWIKRFNRNLFVPSRVNSPVISTN